MLSRFEGEAGMDIVRGLASLDSAALYFRAEGGMRLGVVARETAASAEDVETVNGRLGVKGVGRAILLGVGAVDM